MKTRREMVSLGARAAVAIGLLAGTARASDPPPPTSCQTPHWAINVTAGPCPVSCSSTNDSSPFCDVNALGQCTGIEYTVTQLGAPTPDYVVSLTRDVTVAYSLGPVYAPCVGDPTLKVGKYECQEQAVRLNSPTNPAINRYRLVVQGDKAPLGTAIVIKANSLYLPESCRIAGFGIDESVDTTSCVPSCGGFHPKQVLTRKELLKFGNCEVEFTYDTTNGSVLQAVLTPDSLSHGCSLMDQPVGNLHITLSEGEGEVSLGDGTFGDGYISSGSSSCTSRVIGGRVYIWGNPCPGNN